MRMRLVTVVVVIAFGACSHGPSETDSSLEVAGTYVGGFESSFFGPCGTSETWWVQTDSAFQAKYGALVTQQYEPVFVRMRGDRSELGRYGHEGLAVREFVVKEVLEMRHSTSTDCGS